MPKTDRSQTKRPLQWKTFHKYYFWILSVRSKSLPTYTYSSVSPIKSLSWKLNKIELGNSVKSGRLWRWFEQKMHIIKITILMLYQLHAARECSIKMNFCPIYWLFMKDLVYRGANKILFFCSRFFLVGSKFCVIIHSVNSVRMFCP